MSNWASEITSIAIEILDYGVDFNMQERCDYRIATFTSHVKRDFIPGVYENKTKMRTHILGMAKRISEINESPCNIVDDIHEEKPIDYEKNMTLENRNKLRKKQRRQKNSQRRKDNGLM